MATWLRELEALRWILRPLGGVRGWITLGLLVVSAAALILVVGARMTLEARLGAERELYPPFHWKRAHVSEVGTANGVVVAREV